MDYKESDVWLMCGDCTERVKEISDKSVDLTVTSPPYDNIRSYNGNNSSWSEEIWKTILKELHRVTSDGGVVVWVVADSVVKGSETGTSFKQALYGMEVGFRLHDTMIYAKDSFSFPMNTRYHQVFEYMFVFSKGSPKTFNMINDRKNKSAGAKMTGTDRQKDGSLKKIPFDNRKNNTVKEFGGRFNIWEYKVGRGKMGSDSTTHPAVFPESLAVDHIISWSNEGDVVFDPFMGSGTTGCAAIKNNRRFIGIELDQQYFKESKERVLA